MVFSRELAGADFSDQRVKQLEFSEDNQSLVVVQNLGSDEDSPSHWANALALRRADDGSWRVSAQFKHSDQDPIQCADISANGNRVITGSSRGRITIWDAEAATPSQNNELISVAIPEPTADLPEKDVSDDRELLTISRLRSAVRSVAFVQEESAVVAMESRSPSAVIFPTEK